MNKNPQTRSTLIIMVEVSHLSRLRCRVVFTLDVQYTGSIELAQPSNVTSTEHQHVQFTLVCHHCQQQAEKSICFICQSQTTENLWICVICGFVGCGR
ncbi:BRAP2 RING ZnF UBP domain-containing protein 2-like isoform X1 [Vicia villosa]|uniref:BRAP2 RING ZnF UBP domain-containing protein 2-like isoform X1 n=2 Tax=Vicia villosa TaxID=3911 RepID=UPI00273B7580|nr:BRAP2 RING ZnF UBP domain-containing protein 2-like isoform X1 [Vicia villosa]